MENLQLFNESNDHKYFTIIPNFILNHSTGVAQALYSQLKRLAGDGGTAYPGKKYLMGKLGISKNTLNKELDYLLEKGWIKYVGERSVQTDGGRQMVNAYKVIDLWQLNAEYYSKQRGVKIEPPCERGVKIDHKGGSTRGVKIDHKEEPCIKNQNTEEENDDFSAKKIFELWNSKKIITHRKLTWKMETKIRSALKEYSFVDITAAIANYSEIIGHPELYWWTCKWTLEDFLARGLTRFLETPKDNFFKERRAKEKKPFYRGMPMRQMYGKWQVLDRGDWKEYADSESLIEYK